MSSKNSRLKKPVPMHRNRGYWERIIDADEVRGKHLKEKRKKLKLPVFEGHPVATPVERLPYLGYPVMVSHDILEGQGPNEGQT